MATNDKTSEQAPDPRQQTLIEIVLMLRYALAEGLEIGAPVTVLLKDIPAESADISGVLGRQQLSTLLDLHTALAKTVAPATPASITQTEPVEGFLGFSATSVASSMVVTPTSSSARA